MNVAVVYVKVKPEHVDDFIAATKVNHENSIKEPGNFRFDVVQAVDDPTSFVLYEVYETDDNTAAHKQTQHYLTWRKTVADWMAEPRKGVPYRLLFPEKK